MRWIAGQTNQIHPQFVSVLLSLFSEFRALLFAAGPLALFEL
jgi:hypothetical protein